jgi:hypothetical protein
MAGGDVMGCEMDVVVLSLHPNKPGVSHFAVLEEEVGEIEVGSLQPPKKPGDWQVVVPVVVFVAVGIIDRVLLVVVVVLSLHPNQPGVLHVDVVEEVVMVIGLVVVAVVVVLSSKQPHQPGVLQVSVLVRIFEVLEEDLEEVVGSELLLSKYFHNAQSLHSGVVTHSGTVSYFLMISSMTKWIL